MNASMPRTGQNARAPKTIHLDELGDATLTPGAAAMVVQELIKYFLYMRGQLPGTFDDLDRILQASAAL